MNDAILKSCWGNNPVGYSYQPSSGASGGLVTAWDASRLDVWFSMSFKHVLIIKGTVIDSGVEFIIFNVYAPCDLAAKKDLWERMKPLVLNNNDLCLCVCGDFNSVRYVEERKGRGLVFGQVDANLFNKFINDCLLIDLPFCGRLFTWYRGDEISMSRLDKFLLSSKWCEKWPNYIQVAYQRGLSDHVPLLLHIDEVNWGARPLQMLKCWSDLPGYTDFVRAKWGTFNCEGWGGHVLQQKLKLMKFSLKEWHQHHVQNMGCRMTEVQNNMSVLDIKAELSVLSDEEAAELHELSVNLHSMARLQTNINWQNSRMKWLEEGDANSKFFHGCMSNRRRQNAINVVSVEGVRVEGVQNVCAAVFCHFSNHFKSTGADRSGVDGLHF